MAGMPLSNDVVKCRLREVDLADYSVALTPEEESRLRQMFPQGVCDYSPAWELSTQSSWHVADVHRGRQLQEDKDGKD